MSTNQLPKEHQQPITGKPLQRIPWSEKIADQRKWFKKNIDYHINISSFNYSRSNESAKKRDIRTLYQVYNNHFPMNWFNHFTDPLNAENPLHKKYPAKVRPTAMLRTNIDLLWGEYPERPFVYQVVNMGEDAYNSYLESMSASIKNNLQEHFLAVAQQAMKASGYEGNFTEVPTESEIEMPESIRERFTAKYKDNLAIRGQKWVTRALREYQIKEKLIEMFKDWLIAGEVRSYKNIENGNFRYDRVGPMELDHDRSETVRYVEDGEWAVRRNLWNISDVVDSFYDDLKEQDHHNLEMRNHWVTPDALFTYLGGKADLQTAKIPVYHVEWKGKKEVLIVEVTDPFTGETSEMNLDEDTPLDASMKVVKRIWVNEIYEGWRLGDDIYVRMRPIPVQRNEMNNFSVCKLSYNGRNYSDTYDVNISVLEMGIPYAIMYMATNFSIEKTMAKNKGKFTLVDQNTIPQGDGWDDEKFFYYADALGWMVINRNQVGADKSFNQYQSVDMGLMNDIKNLIELRDSFKRDWDELLGVNPQRKAQIGTSAGKGTTEEAIFRSTVITNMIFTTFEQFVQRELQGLLDFSRFINVEGIKSIYNLDDFDTELLSIDPNSYCSAELGLFMQNSAEELNMLNGYKAQTQALIQNNVKASTILEIAMAKSSAELLTKLKRIEEIETDMAAREAESEGEREERVLEIQGRLKEIESMLRIDEINAEWDRRDQNTMMKGEYDIYAAANIKGDGDADNNGVPDAAEIGKRIIETQKLLTDERLKQQDMASKNKMHNDQMQLEREKLQVQKEAIASKERTEKLKAKTALKNKTTGEK